MSVSYDQLQALDAEVYGVNQADAASHRAFIDALALPFDLLVDEDLAGARAYGALKPEGNRINRTVALIGKDGRILHYEHGAPSPESLLEVLRSANDS